ncbi:MAG: IclR family transcriptional regulator [Dehalococcoidales bacterium]|nr:IclR family transcriptional regulator [Dehalococcoidales bacterium]
MKSLSKALDILQIFLENRKELSLGEIAKLSKLNKATVSRILRTLLSRDYIKQKARRGNYSLGPIYLGFSGIVKNEIQLRKVAINHLVKLASDTGETVMIAYGNGTGTIITETFHDIQSPQILKVVPEEGTGMPLYATSLGKILLANMTEDEIKMYLNERRLRSYTPNTITNIEDLKNQLKLVRKEGIAIDDQEYAIGVGGTAAAIRDNNGRILGAIGIIAPSARLNLKRMRELTVKVIHYAKDISKELGFQVR